MRRSRDFKEFLRQKYDAGRGDIQHPDPRKRQRRPTVKFWTAMKYDTFKEKVKREFQAWLQEEEARRPRAAIGDRVRDVAQLREGDFLQQSWGGPAYKVISTAPKSVLVVQVDRFGRPTGRRPKRFTQATFRRKRLNRREELKRSDVQLEEAQAYINEHHGYPPRDVQNKQDYAKWLEKKFTQGRQSPFHNLGDDETEHKEQLQRHIKKILEARGVDDDWEWQPPPRVQVGQRVQHPLQLQAGDFVQYYDNKYRVISGDDEQVRAVPVDSNGRPRGAGSTFSKDFLRRYRLKRIEAVQRPDVSFDKAREFADAHMASPPRNVNSRTEYAKWLEDKFRAKHDSPYAGLGSDEVEHKNALDKQIKKILEARGIGADWEWQPPPELEVGGRVQDGHQLRVGQFFGDSYQKYKVLDIDDNGKVRAVRVDEFGIPHGGPHQFTKDMFQRITYQRSEDLKRPEVDYEQAKRYADRSFPSPKRGVSSQTAYRRWLKKNFLENADSPFRNLQDDETDQKEKLEKFLDKILEARGVGSDWEWTPPDPISLPTGEPWQAEHDQLRRLALGGAKTGRDIPLGSGSINGGVRRTLQLGDETHDFAFKKKANERAVFPGQKSGTLHLREQAAYGIDRLLGDGSVVPPTVSDGEGSYQAFVPNAQTVANGRRELSRALGVSGLVRSPDVIRQALLMALLGSEDDHGNNVMYAWRDPTGPKTPENLRIINIDNGYSLADGKPIRNGQRVGFRDPWAGLGVLGKVYRKELPKKLHDQLKAIDPKEYLRVLTASGAPTDKEGIEAALIRLIALQNNPKLMAKLVEEHGDPQDSGWHANGGGLTKLQTLSHRDPKQLLRDYTTLDPSEVDKIKQMVQDAA